MLDDVILAWEANGQPLPPAHGFPLRLIVPTWYGMASVKWLKAITVIDHPFQGVQQTQVYRQTFGAGDTGRPIQKKAVRDRKSTRLNSSHANISYAVFCLKKKKQ